MGLLNTQLRFILLSMQEKSVETLEETESPFIQVNRFDVQQNAVFIDFERDKILKNLQEYQTLKMYYRISLAKNIVAIKEICNGHHLYYRFLEQLAVDNEQIQLQLIDFLKKHFQKLHTNDQYDKEFLHPLKKLIFSSYLEIKQQTCALLSEVSYKLQDQHKKELLLLTEELQKSTDEQNKIISIQLIAKLTPNMQEEEIQAYFLNCFMRLYKQSTVRIKKEIIYSTSVLAKNVTKNFLNKEIIDNFFIEKCRETVWGIRKACVEIMPQLIILTDLRKQHLSQILINFTKDGNKIVKISAFKMIPQFLANFNSPKIPDKLVELYVNLMDNEINQSLNRDSEIIQKVAFYFPGVMHLLGASKWDQMKRLFNRLLFYKTNEVKLPIASSLHQISRIIGPELSKEYMFTALDNILKDSSDLLKLTAISHLSEFVQLFEKTTRQNLIDVFLVLQKDPKKWRVRFEIAHQLKTLSKIYDTQIVFKYIFPISLKLCNDNVSEVRFQAASQIFFVIDNMKGEDIFQQMALQSIKGFGLSEKFHQREAFAFMVRNLYKLKIFKEKLMDLVLELTKDKIVMVRIALAISLKQIVEEGGESVVMFNEVIEILKQDEQDVSQYLL